MSKTVELARHLSTLNINNMYKTDFYWTWDKTDDDLSKKGVSYRNIWFDSKSDAGKFTAGLFSFPTTYVVDKNGNIVGEPIVGAITGKKQAETLQKLIDQAIANSKG